MSITQSPISVFGFALRFGFYLTDKIAAQEQLLCLHNSLKPHITCSKAQLGTRTHLLTGLLTSKYVAEVPLTAMEICSNQFLPRWLLRHVLQSGPVQHELKTEKKGMKVHLKTKIHSFSQENIDINFLLKHTIVEKYIMGSLRITKFSGKA